MGPLAIGMLINAGFNVMGGITDIGRINEQQKAETAVNNANAAIQGAEISRNYTNLFEKMRSDIGTQINVFATAGVDKASTLFTKGIQEHEKALLDNKANQKSDIRNVNLQRDLSNRQAKITAISNKNKVANDVVGGLMGSWINYSQYNLGRQAKLQGING